jgi:hypothetical protein
MQVFLKKINEGLIHYSKITVKQTKYSNNFAIR